MAALAALSLPRVQPLLSFVTRELLLEVAAETVHLGVFRVIVAVLATAFTVTAAEVVARAVAAIAFVILTAPAIRWACRSGQEP